MSANNGGPAFIERDGWRHSERWKRGGKSFVVEVARHSSPEFNNDFSEVIGKRHNWCVYLYVYPEHSSFEHFNPDGNMHSQPSYECHSYVSLFRVHRDDKGKIASFQLGWDYNHDGDSGYQRYATPDDASSVFYDASRLFDDAKERDDS